MKAWQEGRVEHKRSGGGHYVTLALELTDAEWATWQAALAGRTPLSLQMTLRASTTWTVEPWSHKTAMTGQEGQG